MRGLWTTAVRKTELLTWLVPIPENGIGFKKKDRNDVRDAVVCERDRALMLKEEILVSPPIMIN